ncbi:hypothetical protein [Ferrovibrio sp.]|uniref:hypothetical protein n=1 Tax=Ferrovibrio sp. TaxID=1917215 RepID=UPI00262CE816|nr:hypothetical protein [Ferrovibrio sp.]
MKRLSSGAFAALLMLGACPAIAVDTAPGEAALKDMLAKQKSWILYSEYTDAAVPSDRAQKLRFEYYERDTKLMGRWLLAFGGCEFEVTVTADGFHFPWCPPYNGEPALSFDPADKQYPFKSRNPRKLWLKAVD